MLLWVCVQPVQASAADTTVTEANPIMSQTFLLRKGNPPRVDCWLRAHRDTAKVVAFTTAPTNEGFLRIKFLGSSSWRTSTLTHQPFGCRAFAQTWLFPAPCAPCTLPMPAPVCPRASLIHSLREIQSDSLVPGLRRPPKSYDVLTRCPG